MEAIVVVLLMLLALVVSSVLVRLMPFSLSLPVMQIALGALLARWASLRITLEPELFFFLFLPPLPFLDGWRIP